MTKLVEKVFPEIGETLYTAVLENGLKVFLIPKTDFQESCGMLVVNFGSLDNKFTLDKSEKCYEKGIAHFLEHKLFELEDGQDVSELFTNAGANSNAFTTFDKTCFYFSTVDHLNENLDLLQHFVADTAFTDESIEREKSIIGQEIDMYQDDADYRLYQGILENLYPKTALAQDIAGTQESIANISVADLKENHDVFYSPQEMTLLVVGNFDKDDIFKQIQESQKGKNKTAHHLERQELAYESVVPKASVQMEVTQPKLAIGLRGSALSEGESTLRQELALRLFFAMILGWTSRRYQELYESGQIDDSFDFEIEVYQNFQFLIISLDTSVPIAMATNLRQYLSKVAMSSDLEDLSEEHFEIVKKELYGDFFKSLDSIDNLSAQFINHLADEETYLSVPKLLKTLSFEEVLKRGNDFLIQSDATEFTILPK
ncbi:Peptidase, M16 family [Streptococcus infantarius subsp. infantarius]|uniref:EF-P 5-aminopentanol modification-associated protein YfmH n=1 Tax=Streptococcus infantarius TaxID=102684 RepID=UPI001BDAA25B|nr:pitrilysin family protein [Streptococcus infantarius]MBK8155372.1 insulinase family protein [Streptococcus sp.]MBT0903659.1 insulinase family protein [Streptococcus infantarius subsp. infantarius]MBT0917572.1 insulinase family protein [Streptococcus infantarius subsp. infantarius]MBT0931048.1 insulinase family protein [Streptococcus infantarius subsp. infantarius]MCO4465593.1 Peptidase, M16 family [Streptococcus infantarius subsp. infantarius]